MNWDIINDAAWFRDSAANDPVRVERCFEVSVKYTSWSKSRVRVGSVHDVFLHGKGRQPHSVGSIQCQCQMLPTWQQPYWLSFPHCRILITSLSLFLDGSLIKKTLQNIYALSSTLLNYYYCCQRSFCLHVRLIEISLAFISPWIFMWNNVLYFYENDST